MICWMVAEIWAYGIVDQLVALKVRRDHMNVQLCYLPDN